MKRKKRSAEKLLKADELLGEGMSPEEVAKALGVTVATYSPWRGKYAEVGTSEAKRLHELEKENAKLEKHVRDELLDRELFGALLEARVVLDEYRRHCLDERPHSALGSLTPKEYAQRVGHHGPTSSLSQPGLSLPTNRRHGAGQQDRPYTGWVVSLNQDGEECSFGSDEHEGLATLVLGPG